MYQSLMLIGRVEGICRKGDRLTLLNVASQDRDAQIKAAVSVHGHGQDQREYRLGQNVVINAARLVGNEYGYPTVRNGRGVSWTVFDVAVYTENVRLVDGYIEHGNRFTAVGMVGSDPVVQWNEDNQVTGCRFSLVTNKRRHVGEEKCWMQICTRERLAYICSEYLVNRSTILVEGYLMADKETGGPPIWTKRDDRATYQVAAVNVTFLNRRERIIQDANDND